MYLQQASTYLVTSLDLGRMQARCVRRNVKYYTSTIDMTRVEITGGAMVREGGGGVGGWWLTQGLALVLFESHSFRGLFHQWERSSRALLSLLRR